MNIGIDWSQNSTKRGAVWIAAAVIGVVMITIGRDDSVPNLLLLASAVAGGMGVAIKD